MKNIISKFLLISILSINLYAGELTGIQKYACEAILCLSTGSPPGECSPALAYYYAIKGKTFGITQALRKDFLMSCPVVSVGGKGGASGKELETLIDVIIWGRDDVNIRKDFYIKSKYKGRRPKQANYYVIEDGKYGKAYREHMYTDVPDYRGLYIKTSTGYEKAIEENGKIYLLNSNSEKIEYVIQDGNYIPASQAIYRSKYYR